MNSFTFEEFLIPLDPAVLLMSLIIGVALGISARASGQEWGWEHLFWQLAGGVIFFVPLSLLRAFQGSTTWERFLATIVLWFLFVVGMNASNRYKRKP